MIQYLTNIIIMMLRSCKSSLRIADSSFHKRLPPWVRVIVKRHFQQFFSYIVAVNFIGEGNRSTRKTQQSYCNFIS